MLPKAIIAGAFQTGVLSVRNLKRRGVEAYCFDSDKRLQGFRSVYGPALLCPNPDSDSEGWLQFMLELAGDLGEQAVVIPSSDRYVLALARHRDRLSKHFLISPGIDLQGQLALKQTQYRLALDHGMPMPRTTMAKSRGDIESFAAGAKYPCLLKPWHFREWENFPDGHPLLNQKVGIAHSASELLDLYELARPANPEMVAQEIIQGPDTNKRVYVGCYDARGKRIANAMFKELRCVPTGFGPATVSEPVDDPEADAVCNAFLESIGYSGICEIEVKRDADDGMVKLIEANPRLSGGGDAAPYAGVDLVWIHYQDMIGRTQEYVSPSGKMFKHIVVRSEGAAVPAYMRAGLLSWRELFASYKPPLAFFDLDLRDWKISLENLAVCLRQLLSGLFSRPRNKVD